MPASRYRATWRDSQWVVIDTTTGQIVGEYGTTPEISAENARSAAKARNQAG